MLTKCENISEYTDDTYQVFFSVSCSEDNIYYLNNPNIYSWLRLGNKFSSTFDLPMDIDEGHSLLSIAQESSQMKTLHWTIGFKKNK